MTLSVCLCVSVCLFVYLSVSVCVCLSIYLSVCLSVCVCVSVCLSVCRFVYLPVCLSVCLSICLSVCLSACLFVYLSVCLSICLSVCMHVSPKFFCKYSRLMISLVRTTKYAELEWDALVKDCEGSKYIIEYCRKEPFLGINNSHLYQRLHESGRMVHSNSLSLCISKPQRVY